jgi:putative tryptophan/tyrosine transport system substrate-binding protein
MSEEKGSQEICLLNAQVGQISVHTSGLAWALLLGFGLERPFRGIGVPKKGFFVKTILSLLVIVAAAALLEGSAKAQPSPQAPRIGVLVTGALPTLGERPSRQLFVPALQELGYIDGQTVILEIRSSEGKLDLLPNLAADLVRLKVSVIVAAGPEATGAAIKATRTIPIVMHDAGDPVSREFVESLSMPGGNVTGLSSAARGVYGKQMELLKDIIPSVSRVALLNSRERKGFAGGFQRAAKALHVELEPVDVNSAEQFEGAFAKITSLRPDALITAREFLTIRHGKQIADFALKQRLPSMYESREFVQAGGLLSYGVNYRAAWRRAAFFVDKILKGANPANLPVEAPQIELVINLGTAKKLGITIAPELLLEADEVIK